MSYFIIFGMIQQGIEHATLCSQGEHADTIGGGFMCLVNKQLGSILL